MTCPKCNAEKVQIQFTEKKPGVMWGFILLFGGLGLMFLGIIGAIIGIVLGLIIGGIVKNCLPKQRTSYGVCQECGHTWEVRNEKA